MWRRGSNFGESGLGTDMLTRTGCEVASGLSRPEIHTRRCLLARNGTKRGHRARVERRLDLRRRLRLALLAVRVAVARGTRVVPAVARLAPRGRAGEGRVSRRVGLRVRLGRGGDGRVEDVAAGVYDDGEGLLILRWRLVVGPVRGLGRLAMR